MCECWSPCPAQLFGLLHVRVSYFLHVIMEFLRRSTALRQMTNEKTAWKTVTEPRVAENTEIF